MSRRSKIKIVGNEIQSTHTHTYTRKKSEHIEINMNYIPFYESFEHTREANKICKRICHGFKHLF